MIAISGVGIVSALGVGVEANLQKLCKCETGIREAHITTEKFHVPAGEVQHTNDELKSMLGIATEKLISRTTLLGMLAAKEAVDSAQLANLKNVAFISSTTVGGMDLTPTFYKDYVNSGSGNLHYVAQHDCGSSTLMIRDYCGLGGYYTAISTACSSSANAIMLGARLLDAGEADAVVVGGTDALCDYTFAGFNSLMLLSTRPCRPFDRNREGLNLGEGAAFLVLQRAENATNIYAYLSGYANANDAHHQTAMSDDGRGAQMAMLQALRKANIEPKDIDFINVHGTGTQNNDASEMAAMQAVFGNVPPFSSTKAFTGHTLAAAGSIEAVFSIISINNGMLWPTLNYETPMTEDVTKPVTTLQHATVNNVMSTSHGFGGNSTALIFSGNLRIEN
jgi:3-oxoacyl-[acyl-carrier-protein] synthase-1